MNSFITIYAKAKFTVFGIIIFISLSSFAQTINVNSTFTQNDEIFPFGSTGEVYGLRINGDYELGSNSDTSLVRIIFVDSDFNEYLVFEAYPYISKNEIGDIIFEGDETCFSDGFTPYSLIIQVSDAEVTLTNIVLETTHATDATTQQEQHKIDAELEKVDEIRDRIEEYQMLWFADTNSISNLSYSEKKSLFGEGYNMCGLDYYVGGIFDSKPNSTRQLDNSELVPNFDWRNRHGANDNKKPNFYFTNSDNGKKGWMTKVKNQEAYPCSGLCYIYAPLSAMEAVANLYFNKVPHMDYDLSIQHVLDCDEYTDDQCVSGVAGNTNIFAVNDMDGNPNGIYQEDGCYKRTGSPNIPCKEYLYTNTTDYMFSITGEVAISYPQNDPPDNIKESLILNGPLCSYMPDFYGPSNNHFMVIVGYGVVAEGDRFYNSDGNLGLPVPANHTSIGELYWIYKNSMGTDHGDNGYLYLLADSFKPGFCYYYQTPIIDKKLPTQVNPDCEDKDNDGYFNWGIGERPQGWPPEAKPDSDDSEPRIGPFDDNYFSIPVTPKMEVTYEYNNSPPEIIKDGEFVTFNSNNSTEFTITVKNEGDAQLNLQLAISSNNSVFNIAGLTPTTVPMNGGYITFTVNYTLQNGTNSDQTIITIPTLEPEYGDFQFVLANYDCSSSTGNDINVSTSTEWNESGIITGNLYVTNGAQLTITGHYGFLSNSNILVTQGSKLLLDGAVLTTACDATNWKGIDVWGVSTLSQMVPTNQGRIEIKNNTTIYSAESAIEVAQMIDNVYVVGTTGGILDCKNSHFINNDNDISIYPYSNFDPNTGDPLLNLGYIENTIFEVNKNLLINEPRRIYLNGINSINISGCEFNNHYVNAFNLAEGIGLYSFNSGYYIDGYCYKSDFEGNCIGVKQSSFMNFEKGIYSMNGELGKFEEIDMAIFVNCKAGIYMSSVNNQALIRNTFIIDESNFLDVEACGIYLKNCSNYQIEENGFFNEQAGLKTTGIFVSNSGQIHNEIYNNAFYNLSLGITASGKNRDSEGNGLCIKCNDFDGCETDIFVDDGDYSSGSLIGIAEKQGYLSTGANPNTMGAGNTFTVAPLEYNIDIESDCNSIIYTHQNATEIEDPYNIKPDDNYGGISLQNDVATEYSKEESCPSNLNSSIIDELTEKSVLSNELISINAYTDTLDMLIDGGDTELLNSDITFSLPDEALELRLQLLDESPYLSDTAMKTAINKEGVLPNVMIKDILVANPQSSKSPDIIGELDNRIASMPDYYMAEIMNGQYLTSAAEVLEQKLVFHRKTRNISFGKLEKHYLRDTSNLSIGYDSLSALYLNEPFKSAKYKLALKHLVEGDSTAAYKVLENIPVEYELNELEEYIHEDYEILFDVLEQIHCDSILLDSSMSSSLTTILDKSNIAGNYARNILLNESSNSDSIILYYPDGLKSQQTWGIPNMLTTNEPSYLKAFPNPAGNYFIVEYNCIEFTGLKQIFVVDIYGHNLFTKTINNESGQLLFATQELSPGTYIIKLLYNNRFMDSKKIIISK